MDKKYKLPAIAWLKVTDYMHGWLQYELGSALRIKEQHVLSVQHLPGARAVLRMETEEDMMDQRPVANAMSATRKNCIEAGLDLDPATIEKTYGMTKEGMQLFVPIECPKLCLTRNGVLRPWTLDVNFGVKQATALQRLLRQEFWKAVESYDAMYARQADSKKYPAVEMIEAFCADTQTPDLHVEAMRREWQRRMKRTEGS